MVCSDQPDLMIKVNVVYRVQEKVQKSKTICLLYILTEGRGQLPAYVSREFFDSVDVEDRVVIRLEKA